MNDNSSSNLKNLSVVQNIRQATAQEDIYAGAVEVGPKGAIVIGKQRERPVNLEPEDIIRPEQRVLGREESYKVTDYYTNLIYIQDKAPGYMELLRKELQLTYGDIMGYITSWNEYFCENRHRVCYPNAQVGEFNPFNKWDSIRKSSGRTMRNLEKYKELDILWDLVFTYPSEVSKMTMTEELQRRCRMCFVKITNYIESQICPSGVFAWSMNEHIWKSENPLSPHIHHHTLLLDVYFNGDKKGKITTNYFMRWNPRTRRSESSVFTELIKSKWAEIVNKEFGTNYQKLDVHVEYRNIKKEPEKVVHKLKYNKRNPLADLADYYLSHNYNPESYDKNYMQELLLYKNKTHNYGYWNRMSRLLCTLGNVEIEKHVHRCPICAAKAYWVRTWKESDIPQSYLSVYIDRKGRMFRSGVDDG